jgi:Tfp pilus assembly protein PilF
VSVSPLYKDAKAEKPFVDARIEGEWVMADAESGDEDDSSPKPPCTMKIVKTGDDEHGYDVTYSCPESNSENSGAKSYETRKYQARLVELNGATFFDAGFRELQSEKKHIELSDVADEGVAPAHLIGELWVQQDFVRFSPLSAEWVDENWPGEFLVKANNGTRYGNVDVLTNPTESLRNAVRGAARSDKAFDFASYLCRPNANCDERAIEDALARTPDDKDVLLAGAGFYARRGNFARAVTLQKHAMEIETDQDAKKTAELQLGRSLLLAREFAAARDEFSRAKEPEKPPSTEALVVQSYFLEGDYQGAIKAARSLPSAAEMRSSDAILLSYFAQHRVGKHKEAEAYLQQQAATFTGPAVEHLYLLKALGRVTDTWDGQDLKRTAYYGALKKIQEGDTETGMTQLQNVLTMRPLNDLTGVAARVELERLKALQKK